MVAVSADSVESHQRFCQALGGRPFSLGSDKDLEVARQYRVVGEDGHRSQRAVFVIDPDAASGLHQIPWFQPRFHRGQFIEIFRALGAI